MSMDLSDYLDLFLAESRDLLDSMDAALVRLEQDPEDAAALATLFRAAHTLKGLSAGTGYAAMSQVAHAMEDLFGRLQGQGASEAELTQTLFEGVDLLRHFVDALEAGQPDEVDLASYLARLQEAAQRAIQDVEQPARPAPTPPAPAPEDATRVRVDLSPDVPASGARAYVILRRLAGLGELVAHEPSVEEMKGPSFGGRVTIWLRTERSPDEIRALLAEYPEVASVEVSPPRPRDAGPAPSPPGPLPASRVQANVRVRLDLLERLTDLMAELLVSRARLEERVRHASDEALKDLVHEHAQILDRVRETVLDLRMVPAGTLLHRYPRVVRDLLRATGKEAQLVVEGAEIELDRAILNRLDEPLIHLIRNAVAHGLESPEERERKGKPRKGTLALRVRREQDTVVVEVSDDGKGLDREHILRTAVEAGILRADTAERLSDPEVWRLIWHRGFSTVEGVTSVAGRGVGMRAVLEAVEEMRGQLEVETERDKGTTFRIHLPLSLAILQAVVVEAEGQLLGIPMSQVARVVSLGDGERPQGELVLEGRVVPVWDLLSLLAGAEPAHGEIASTRRQALVVGRTRWEAALAVDALLGVREVVVRPFKGLLARVPGLEGAAILADGRIALVCDALSLLRKAERPMA